MTFKIGDLVELKSGGPKMTVSRLDDAGAGIECVWFESSKHNTAIFLESTLKKFQATAPPLVRNPK